jgi:hypothetical protein
MIIMMQARRYNNRSKFCSLIIILFLMVVSCQAKKISGIRDTAIQKQNAAEHYYKKKDYAKAKKLCEEAIASWNQIKQAKSKTTPDWAINNNITRCENILDKSRPYITSLHEHKEGEGALMISERDRKVLEEFKKDHEEREGPVTIFERVQTAFEKYKTNSKFIPFKALAVDPEECQKRNENCEIYAIGNTLVSDMSPEQVAAVCEEYFATVAEAAGPRRGTIRLAPTQKAPGADLASKQLSADEIRSYLAGSTTEGTTINGVRFVVKCSADGTMSGKASTYDAEINVTDNGTWWVEDDKLCRQWERWQGGEVGCAVIVTDGKTFIFYGSDGEIERKYTVLE